MDDARGEQLMASPIVAELLTAHHDGQPSPAALRNGNGAGATGSRPAAVTATAR